MVNEHSVAERDLVIQHWKGDENGRLSVRGISKLLKIPKSTVHNIIVKFQNTKKLENLKGRGRKSILSEREKKAIVRKVKVNPRLSAPKILSEIQNDFGKSPSLETIRNVLHQNDFKNSFAKKKPLISKKNQKKRLDFARLHASKDISFWKSILWSDESRYKVFGSDGRLRVWRKPLQSLKMQNLNPTVKHGGGSCMVWGCMAFSGAGKLEFIEGIMNQIYYQDILSRNLKESVRKLRLGRRYIFQQDNDPKHKSKSTMEYFLKNKINVLDWPPQSPDLNPIEHLWDHVEKEIRKHQITSKQDLKIRIQEAWDAIPEDVTKNLVESMPRRLLAVVAAHGGPTRY